MLLRTVKRKVKELLQPYLDLVKLKERINFYSQFNGKNKLFFDIGANVGNRASVFRRLGVRVVAVEPQVECANILKEKFKDDSDVVVVNKGLDSEEHEATMHICTSANTLSTFSSEWQEGRFSGESFDREEKIQMTTLSSLVRTYGVPDFCKIDVEGYELQVLRGLDSKIPCLSFEFTSEYISRAKEIITLLIGLGFSEFSLQLGEEMTKELVWVSGSKIFELLDGVIKEDNLAWGDIYAR